MNESLELLAPFRIIPTVVIDDARAARPLSDALIAGGMPVAEVALRTAESLSAMERMIERRDMIVGAGTVTTLAQFDAAWRLGARFIVTPGIDENIIRHGKRRDLLVIPGVVSPTEIMQAQNLGLSLVKFFPAEAFGGVKVLEAMSGPFPKMRFLATGGVNLENLAGYLQHRSVFACGGTWMARREWIKESAWEKVREACAATQKIARPGV